MLIVHKEAMKFLRKRVGYVLLILFFATTCICSDRIFFLVKKIIHCLTERWRESIYIACLQCIALPGMQRVGKIIQVIKSKNSDECYSKSIEARYYSARKSDDLLNSHLEISKATCNWKASKTEQQIIGSRIPSWRNLNYDDKIDWSYIHESR